ncbi:MAG: hypothetical protein GF315_08025, partial [candidate division Zixibacteria bacterium]|nr:hypothetical protein [candidate division Zixibacteria bacterium]
LGVTTNLTDATPWGLWIGFDVMAGVALASGGFVMTAIFYIMKREEFQPLVKPAVLTAFLGYLAVIFGLMFDLGLPWNIWHMIIFWNPHSPLFEVGWCVMLYTTVLLLEFSPVPMEEDSRYAKIRSVLMKFRFPLVLLGIMLSTLHQSSLGSLFLIMPFKLHPLWYSQILPVQFFLSAIALGLMMISFESLISHWLYGRKAETHLIAKLAKAAIWVLGIYFAVKIAEIAASGELGLIFSGSWESIIFILEILISILIPITIFAIPKARNSRAGQWIGSSMVVVGMVFNRINVGGLTMLRATGDSYVPSWMEISISLGVVSAAVLAFLFAVEKFHIWEKRPGHPESDPYAQPSFDRTSEVWLGTPGIASAFKYSLAFILAFSIGFALIPADRIHSEGVESVETQGARGSVMDTLFIDGNFDGFGVSFGHAKHAQEIIGDEGCVKCHHMSLPRSKENGCWECHESMYTEHDFFGHDWHTSVSGAGIACVECHPQGELRQASTAKSCDKCHSDMVKDYTGLKEVNFMAPSYVDALHETCITCHEQKSRELPDKEQLAICTSCHAELYYATTDKDEYIAEVQRKYNHVIVPTIELGEQEE